MICQETHPPRNSAQANLPPFPVAHLFLQAQDSGSNRCIKNPWLRWSGLFKHICINRTRNGWTIGGFNPHKYCLNPSHSSCCYSLQLYWCWRPKMNSLSCHRLLSSWNSVVSKQPAPEIQSPETQSSPRNWSSFCWDQVHGTQTESNRDQWTWCQHAGCGKGTHSSQLLSRPSSLAFIIREHLPDAVSCPNCKMLAVVSKNIVTSKGCLDFVQGPTLCLLTTVRSSILVRINLKYEPLIWWFHFCDPNVLSAFSTQQTRPGLRRCGGATWSSFATVFDDIMQIRMQITPSGCLQLLIARADIDSGVPKV